MPKAHSDPLNTQVTPDPALEKRTRRQFKPEYKLRIMAEADARKHGELGALLRREKPLCVNLIPYTPCLG